MDQEQEVKNKLNSIVDSLKSTDCSWNDEVGNSYVGMNTPIYLNLVGQVALFTQIQTAHSVVVQAQVDTTIDMEIAGLKLNAEAAMKG